MLALTKGSRIVLNGCRAEAVTTLFFAHFMAVGGSVDLNTYLLKITCRVNNNSSVQSLFMQYNNIKGRCVCVFKKECKRFSKMSDFDR